MFTFGREREKVMEGNRFRAVDGIAEVGNCVLCSQCILSGIRFLIPGARRAVGGFE